MYKFVQRILGRVLKKNTCFVLGCIFFSSCSSGKTDWLDRLLLTGDSYLEICKPWSEFDDLSPIQQEEQLTCLDIAHHLSEMAIVNNSQLINHDPMCELDESGFHDLTVTNQHTSFLSYIKKHPGIREKRLAFIALEFAKDRFPPIHSKCVIKEGK